MLINAFFGLSDVFASDGAYRGLRQRASSNLGSGHSPPPVEVKNHSPNSGHPAPLGMVTRQ